MGALEVAGLALGIAAAGGLGAVLRLFLSRWNGYLPWGILLANSVASLLAGVVLWAVPNDVVRTIAITGFMGGLSTFSSWAAATAEYWMSNQRLRMVLNWGLNLTLPMICGMLGVAVGGLLIN